MYFKVKSHYSIEKLVKEYQNFLDIYIVKSYYKDFSYEEQVEFIPIFEVEDDEIKNFLQMRL